MLESGQTDVFTQNVSTHKVKDRCVRQLTAITLRPMTVKVNNVGPPPPELCIVSGLNVTADQCKFIAKSVVIMAIGQKKKDLFLM